MAGTLANRLMAIILTDAFVKSIGLVYFVEADDSLWTITDQFYGGYWPEELVDSYVPYAKRVANLNNLDDPDRIDPGMALRIPWYGFNW